MLMVEGSDDFITCSRPKFLVSAYSSYEALYTGLIRSGLSGKVGP